MLQEQEAHAAEVGYLALDYILFLIFQVPFHFINLFSSVDYIFYPLFFPIQMERTFIAIKPDGVQRGLVSTHDISIY